MKRILITTLLIALFACNTFGITYDAAYYATHKGWVGAQNTDLDPIYLNMNEVGTIVEGETGTGVWWYVDASATGQATGKSWEHASVTVDAAIDLSSADGGADRGDRIYVAQGSDETKSATGALFTADIAGMSIIFLGKGDNRAKMTLSHTGAKIDVTANGVRISGLWLDATGIDSVNAPLNISGEGCILDNFYLRLSDTNGQADLGITIGIADGDANDLIIANGVIVAPDADGVSAIVFAKDMENVIFSNLKIYGDFSTAGISAPNGAEVQENLLILDSVIVSKNADEPAIEIYGTSATGVIDGCTLVSDAEATILDAGGLQISNTELLLIGNAEGAALPANMTIVDLLGDFTGPDDGADADDNIKAALDIIIADTEAQDTAAELVALVDPNYVSYDAPRLISDTTSAMTIANGYDQDDDPVIFTVTGDIMARACAYATTQVTSTSSDTLTLGVTGDTACLLLSDVVDGTAFDVNFVWTLTQAPDTTSAELDAEWVVIPGGLDIKLFIDDHGLTAGVMVFYLQWIPLSADAAVVGAAP